MLTGTPAGELVNATRAQFAARIGSMTLIGKAGTRTVPLGPPALTLFKRLARSKLLNAFGRTVDGLAQLERAYAVAKGGGRAMYGATLMDAQCRIGNIRRVTQVQADLKNTDPSGYPRAYCLKISEASD